MCCYVISLIGALNVGRPDGVTKELKDDVDLDLDIHRGMMSILYADILVILSICTLRTVYTYTKPINQRYALRKVYQIDRTGITHFLHSVPVKCRQNPPLKNTHKQHLNR